MSIKNDPIPTGFSFDNGDSNAFNGYLASAQLSVTVAIPEPSSALLLVLGTAMLGRAAMRRR